MSEGIDIRHGCQFLSCLVRALAKLPFGLGIFLPCTEGSHMSKLRHIGWNQCCHGLTSRPLESCHHQCLQAVCGVLGYPKSSALELLDGTLKLPHCTDLFTMRFPPWSLPREVMVVVRGSLVLLVFLLKLVVIWGKEKDTSRCIFTQYPGLGASNAQEMEKITHPFLRRSGGEVGEHRNLFPRLGVG